MPPGHPIMLVKSNYFNMAAVSVKRSIVLVETNTDLVRKIVSFFVYLFTKLVSLFASLLVLSTKFPDRLGFKKLGFNL